MTKYVIDLPDNVSFIVGKGYVLFNEKEFLRIPVKQLEKYSKKEDVEVDKNEKIVFDGRKEEKMSEKYVVSQEFINKLEEWKDTLRNAFKPGLFVGNISMETFPNVIRDWWLDDLPGKDSNNRLIAIIRWVNGEDVFEVEKSKKWIVRSKDCTEQGNYLYVMLDISHGVKKTITFWDKDIATRFDTKEEAEGWANAHQEVVEVKE